MAVYNDYVDTQILAGRITSAQTGQGTRMVATFCSFDTVAAHDAGSIYRVIRGIPATAVPLELWIYTDGVTGMNDVNVSLYKPLVNGVGAEVGSEVLASAIDLSSAVARTAPKDGLNNITNSNWGKPLWELAGQTISSRGSCYDVALVSVADLSEADTVVCVGKWLYP